MNFYFQNMSVKVYDPDFEAFVWYKDGEIHRDDDLPAMEYTNGDKVWYKHGMEHRDEDKPAFEYADGSKEWFQNGELHRDGDKPAREDADGGKIWFQHGKRHRDGDMPAVEYVHGDKMWYQHGKLHREADKPALEGVNGDKFWFQNDKLHRDGGKPAVENVYGTVDYWIHGERVYMWQLSQKSLDMIGAECVITLEVIYNDTDCGFCITCRKAICIGALKEWLKEKKSCPHCRSAWTNFVVYK